jgi:predicted enzyme related to lactoylglutathione lyase
VWVEPERAGRGTVVLATDDDLDSTAARLAASGLTTGAPGAGGGARVLQLTDPDGNRVVVVGR